MLFNTLVVSYVIITFDQVCDIDLGKAYRGKFLFFLVFVLFSLFFVLFLFCFCFVLLLLFFMLQYVLFMLQHIVDTFFFQE